jgi:hypothetical protein
MARGGGSIVAGGIYHVIPRFVANEWLMEGPGERNMYLSLFGGEIVDTDWRCFSYALMSSHLHLAFVAGRDPLAEWMRPLHTKFANWVNERRERIGAVFVKGPNVIEFQPEGAARLISYIHANPVRAEVVARPEDSDWTSFRAYVGAAPRKGWLDVDLGLELAGFSNGAELATWMRATTISRKDLDAVRVAPTKRRGPRPRTRGLELPMTDQRIGSDSIRQDDALANEPEVGADIIVSVPRERALRSPLW